MIVDLSLYNEPMDYNRMVAVGVDGAILRASIGINTDTSFQKSWQALSSLGVDLSAYLVVWPTISAKQHIQTFKYIVGDRKFSDRFFGVPVLDVEVRPSDKKSYTNLIADISNAIADMYGKRPIIYTRQTFWDYYVEARPIWREHPLWLALYVPFKASGNDFIPTGNVWGPNNRYKFRDWDNWFMWQFTADTNNLGKYFGVGTDSIDLNIINTDYLYTPKSSTTVTVTSPLNMRSAPSTSANRIATLPPGTVLNVEEDDGTWLKVSAYVYKSYTKRA